MNISRDYRLLINQIKSIKSIYQSMVIIRPPVHRSIHTIHIITMIHYDIIIIVLGHTFVSTTFSKVEIARLQDL